MGSGCKITTYFANYQIFIGFSFPVVFHIYTIYFKWLGCFLLVISRHGIMSAYIALLLFFGEQALHLLLSVNFWRRLVFFLQIEKSFEILLLTCANYIILSIAIKHYIHF